jgi:hypothetical protein
MLGAAAIALEDFGEHGRVWAFSDNWQARSSQPVTKGATLRVTGVDGLVLTVEPDSGIGARGTRTQARVGMPEVKQQRREPLPGAVVEE